MVSPRVGRSHFAQGVASGDGLRSALESCLRAAVEELVDELLRMVERLEGSLVTVTLKLITINWRRAAASLQIGTTVRVDGRRAAATPRWAAARRPGRQPGRAAPRRRPSLALVRPVVVVLRRSVAPHNGGDAYAAVLSRLALLSPQLDHEKLGARGLS